MIGCCCVNTFLIFYAIFVLILVIIQAAFLGMFFNGNFDDKIKSEYEVKRFNSLNFLKLFIIVVQFLKKDDDKRKV